MLRKLAVLLVMLVLLSLSVTPAFAIPYGEPDFEHDYVGLVVFYVEQEGALIPAWRCTGSLLSPTVLLTAGHCTSGATQAQVWFQQEIIPEESGFPFTGGVIGEPITHPKYDDFAAFPETYDVGVVLLNEPVTDVSTFAELPELHLLNTLEPRRGPDYPTFTVVGYGLQGVKPTLLSDLVRLRGTVKLVNLTSALTDGSNIHLSNNPGKKFGPGGQCFGDSGGPVFLDETNTVVGVISFGLNANCKGAGFAYRVDIEEAQSFLNTYLD